MTIDLFPTIARLAGAELPGHAIDGLDVWPLLAGEPGARNPHEAYLFYYGKNELQAVASGDGRWKLQLPHTYTTLAGRPGGRGGTPVEVREAHARTSRALRPRTRRGRDPRRRLGAPRGPRSPPRPRRAGPGRPRRLAHKARGRGRSPRGGVGRGAGPAANALRIGIEPMPQPPRRPKPGLWTRKDRSLGGSGLSPEGSGSSGIAVWRDGVGLALIRPCSGS